MNPKVFKEYYEKCHDTKNIEFPFPSERLQLNVYFTKSGPLNSITNEQLENPEIKSKLIKDNVNKLDMCLGFESEIFSGEKILTGVTFDHIIYFFQTSLNYFHS
jgi:hypothetical protein